jgi:tRNA(fMet)-specific endonuclease VapC
MAFLLDTNAWIVFLKGRNVQMRERLDSHETDSVFVCSIVKAELFHGAMKYLDPNLRRDLLGNFLAPYESLPFNDAAAEIHGKLRHNLEIKGQIIGSYDLMIASIAIANGLTLVTGNVREFSRIPELKIENWEE